MPVIWKRAPNSSLDGRRPVSTSHLPFSISTMAMRLPILSRVRFAHLAAAVAVQVDADRRLLVLVEAGGGAGDVVAGDDDVLVHHRPARRWPTW